MLSNQVKSQIAEVNAHFNSKLDGENPGKLPGEDPLSADSTPVTPPVVKAPDETIPKRDHEHVSQQLRSLQGIHKSIETERSALRAQVATLVSTVDALKQQVGQYEAITHKPKLITEAEIAEYTPELIDVISRKAKEEFAPVIDNLKATINQLTQRNSQLELAVIGVTKTANKADTTDFLGEISRIMPDWMPVNDDPRFMDWLQETNPLTGRQFSVDFYAARDEKNAPRIVNYFQLFANNTQPAPQGTKTAKVPKLSELVSPTSGGNSSEVPKGNGKMWSQAAIATFYRDRAAGRYASNPTIAASLEADLFRAQAEGRVTA